MMAESKGVEGLSESSQEGSSGRNLLSLGSKEDRARKEGAEYFSQLKSLGKTSFKQKNIRANIRAKLKVHNQEKKGSEAFNDVNEKLEKILSVWEEKSTKDLNEIKRLYEELFSSLDNYMNRKNIAYFKKGKQRLGFVECIYNLAACDYNELLKNIKKRDEGQTKRDSREKLRNDLKGDGRNVNVSEVFKDAEDERLKLELGEKISVIKSQNDILKSLEEVEKYFDMKNMSLRLSKGGPKFAFSDLKNMAEDKDLSKFITLNDSSESSTLNGDLESVQVALRYLYEKARNDLYAAKESASLDNNLLEVVDQANKDGLPSADEYLSEAKNSIKEIVEEKEKSIPTAKDQQEEYQNNSIIFKEKYDKVIKSSEKIKDSTKEIEPAYNLFSKVHEFADSEQTAFTYNKIVSNQEAKRLGFDKWKDLIVKARIKKYNIGDKVGEAGAGCSSLYIFDDKEKNNKKFFKQEETLYTENDGRERIESIVESISGGKKPYIKAFFDNLLRSLNGEEAIEKVWEWFFKGRLFEKYECLKNPPQNDNDSVSKYTNAATTASYLLQRYTRFDCAKFSSKENAYPVIDILKSMYEVSKLHTAKNVATSIAGMGDGAKISPRNVATTRLASLVDTSDTVAQSEFAYLEEGDDKRGGKYNKKIGNVMEEAKGVSAGDVIGMIWNNPKIEIIKVCKKFQKQITDLQALDAMAFQVDRHGGNYHIDYKMENDNCIVFKSLQGIDNDASFGSNYSIDKEDKRSKRYDIINSPDSWLLEYNRGSTNRNQYNWGFFFDDWKTGESTLPHMSEETANNILNLKESTIKYAFADVLNEEEIKAFIKRVEYIKKVIRTTKDKNKDFLKKHDDYNQDSLDSLLNGDSNYFNREFVLRLKRPLNDMGRKIQFQACDDVS